VALNEALNEREDAFLIGSVRSELKEAEEDSTDYMLLTQVKDLLDERTKLNRDIKKLETELKDITESRIETLTDEEIDSLIDELTILEQLQERYSDTLDELEAESEKLEKELEAMMEQMVVRE